MTDTERHVKRFVFGRLLPVRGVESVWERRYGWHWVVEKEVWNYARPPAWKAAAWLHEVKPKQGWPEIEPWIATRPHGYQPKRDGKEGSPPGSEQMRINLIQRDEMLIKR